MAHFLEEGFGFWLRGIDLQIQIYWRNLSLFIQCLSDGRDSNFQLFLLLGQLLHIGVRKSWNASWNYILWSLPLFFSNNLIFTSENIIVLTIVCWDIQHMIPVYQSVWNDYQNQIIHVVITTLLQKCFSCASLPFSDAPYLYLSSSGKYHV